MHVTKPENLQWAATAAVKLLTCKASLRTSAGVEASQELLLEEEAEDKLQGTVRGSAAKICASAGVAGAAAGKRKDKLQGTVRGSAAKICASAGVAGAAAGKRKAKRKPTAEAKTTAVNGARSASTNKLAAGPVVTTGQRAAAAQTPSMVACGSDAGESDLPQGFREVSDKAEVSRSTWEQQEFRQKDGKQEKMEAVVQSPVETQQVEWTSKISTS